jgi:diguanylate cyclase (GGDEF)-like protein
LVCGAERVDASIRRIAALAVAANIRGADDWRFGIAGYPDHGHKTSELYVRATSMIAEAKRTRLLMAGMSSPESVAEESKIPSDSVDPATGLLREEKMIGVMRRFIAQERRAEQPASLIYFDVDQPERLRDLHGPAPVDSMIKELAEILDAGIRESDVVARFGAYGFVVSMSSAPGSAALSAQRILNTVRKHAFRAGGGMKVSMCAGVAGYPDVIGTAVQYFIAAEAALRVAKSKGKNQCATYDRNMQIPSEGEKAVDHL